MQKHQNTGVKIKFTLILILTLIQVAKLYSEKHVVAEFRTMSAYGCRNSYS